MTATTITGLMSHSFLRIGGIARSKERARREGRRNRRTGKKRERDGGGWEEEIGGQRGQ